MNTLVVICSIIAGPFSSTNVSLWKKNDPLFFREEIVFIDHNESNGTINALRLGNSLLFPDQDHDFDNCQEALFEHLTIAKARTKLTG